MAAAMACAGGELRSHPTRIVECRVVRRDVCRQVVCQSQHIAERQGADLIGLGRVGQPVGGCRQHGTRQQCRNSETMPPQMSASKRAQLYVSPWSQRRSQQKSRHMQGQTGCGRTRGWRIHRLVHGLVGKVLEDRLVSGLEGGQVALDVLGVHLPPPARQAPRPATSTPRSSPPPLATTQKKMQCNALQQQLN